MYPIKNFFLGKVEFKVQGLPLSCLNKLRIYHITRIRLHDDIITFQAPLSQVNYIKKLLTNFEYCVTENFNIFRGVNYLLNHLVLVVSVVVAMIAFFVVDMRIYNVRVQCNDTSMLPAVTDYLTQIGVKKYMLKKEVNNFSLASDLVGNFANIAHAHVQISGNTLVIDLVTANNQTHKVKTNFYAQYDAVIKEVNVYSGRSLVSVGDVVRKGDLLIEDAYPDSVVVTGEVAFTNGDQISRLVIWII